MGCIDMNAWSARADRPDRPDWVMFDLDPAEGTEFAVVVEVAQLLRTALAGARSGGLPEDVGLASGIHVLVPIARRYDQETVRDFAARRGAGAGAHRTRAGHHRVAASAPSRGADRCEPERLRAHHGRRLLGAAGARGARSRRRFEWDEVRPELDLADIHHGCGARAAQALATFSRRCFPTASACRGFSPLGLGGRLWLRLRLARSARASRAWSSDAVSAAIRSGGVGRSSRRLGGHRSCPALGLDHRQQPLAVGVLCTASDRSRRCRP